LTDLKQALKSAVNYAATRTPLPPDIIMGLSALRNVKAAEISDISATYHDAITQILIDYFEGGGSVVGPSNAMKRACSDAFNDASDAGWVDGGAELPIDGDALKQINARTQEEFGNIDSLFQQAKDLRKQGGFDYFSWATARADGYTSTVLYIYNMAALLAKKNQMLEWHLGNAEDHCSTCEKLDGQAHRASWYISHDYIPRKPGAAMDCHGYNCQCWLTDRDGNEVTL